MPPASHVPRIVDIFDDAEKIYIAEDFVEGITLDELIKREKKMGESVALQR